MDILIKPGPAEELALRGGTKAVTATPPASWLLGPQEIGDEEIRAVTEVLRSKSLFRFMKDPAQSPVARFEKLFGEMTGVRHVLAVNSGTSALIAGLIGLGIEPGDEVLVPAYTYIASAAAALAIGAIPVIVEIDESLTIDPGDMEKKIGPRTRAVIPVHMRGTPCDMPRIMEIARRKQLLVLEDCAQANGAEIGGRPVGTFGDAGAFSFQQFKIVTAGEGGVLVTHRQEVFDRASIFHDSAYAFWMEKLAPSDSDRQDWRKICFLGENYRQSELHGAVALEQLKKRDRILKRTRAIKRCWWEACGAIPGARLEAVRDRAGDCGISLVFFMEDSARAGAITRALRAEGVNCGTLFSKEFPDRHIFYHWDYIMEKRTPFRSGFPWTLDAGSIKYTREMCPRTVQLLERAVMMPITHVASEEYVEQVASALRKIGRFQV